MTGILGVAAIATTIGGNNCRGTERRCSTVDETHTFGSARAPRHVALVAKIRVVRHLVRLPRVNANSWRNVVADVSTEARLLHAPRMSAEPATCPSRGARGRDRADAVGDVDVPGYWPCRCRMQSCRRTAA